LLSAAAAEMIARIDFVSALPLMIKEEEEGEVIYI
jgi:hypothetical protein